MIRTKFNKRTIVLLLFINFVLVAFILMRTESASVPDTRTSNSYGFYKRPQPDDFYPDRLSLFDISERSNVNKFQIIGQTRNLQVSAGDEGGFCLTADQLESVIINTSAIPGEWSRYDTLHISMIFSDYFPDSISGFIGALPNDSDFSYIQYNRVTDGNAELTIPLDKYKNTYRVLPQQEPVTITIYSEQQISLCIMSVEVSRYER